MSTHLKASLAVRVAGVTALAIGALIWINPGVTETVRPVHMLAGIVVMAGLLVLARLGIRSGVPVLPFVAIVWAILLPLFGITQTSLTFVPHVVIQTAHLAVGVIAIGLGEMLSLRISRPQGTVTHAPQSAAPQA